MIEVMIPSFMWNNEEWVIKKLQSIENAYQTLRVWGVGISKLLAIIIIVINVNVINCFFLSI